MMKKQLIMEKALELFAKQGIESTSVQQITEHCGMSKGAFYLSFKSKDELIVALIDQFMIQITSDIDSVVRNTSKCDNLLYEFYYTTYHSFHKNADFVRMLIKEQMRSFSKNLLSKMHYYDQLMNQSIIFMIERIYGEEVKLVQYDLMYCIKGLMKTYSELLLFNSVPLDLHLLAQSLAEKTDLLAKHSTIPFLSKELFQVFRQPMTESVSKEKLIVLVEPLLEELEESIEKESLRLLKEQLNEPTLSRAIVKGLLENIRNHPQCKWIVLVLQEYFKF
ncbi:TetR/AcrR family transcriptional regulator [Bacillus salitolerans]|uniref:TetR/AcrR family transcriptional regulator n=1 Tax=Bacillus salitolerans TaxID=1437434 RepID=A0ABW4LUX3_9BACI